MLRRLYKAQLKVIVDRCRITKYVVRNRPGFDHIRSPLTAVMTCHVHIGECHFYVKIFLKQTFYFVQSKNWLHSWDCFTAWKVSVFLVFLVRIFPHSNWIRRDIPCISPYSVRMRENTDQKNSEYGHFSCSVCLKITLTFYFVFPPLRCGSCSRFQWTCIPVSSDRCHETR